LGVLLCFFNDPFYIFEANYGGNHFKVLSIIFQNTFFHTLLLFWLVALDNMRLQGVERGVSNYRFYTPKVIFMLSFWGVTTTTHCYMKYYSNNDPTWDPLEDNDGFHWARTIVWILSGVYWIWLILLVVGSHREVRAKRSRFRYLLFLTFVMILLSFSGLLIEANSPSPRSAGIWTSFHALFNMYIFALSYLFAPSATTIKNAQNMKGEERPALQGEIMDPSTIEIRDKISGEVNGDSSFVVA
jgi:magnesium-transporting ATPase (P-type)